MFNQIFRCDAHLIEVAEEFPKYAEILIRAVLENPNIFKQIIKDVKSLITVAIKFPRHAEMLIKKVLENPNEFNRLVKNSDDLINMKKAFKNHAETIFKRSQILFDPNQFEHSIKNPDALVKLEDPNVFNQIMKEAVALVTAVEKKFPRHTEMQIKKLLKNPDEFNRIIKNSDNLFNMEEEFKNHAETVFKINQILNGRNQFAHFIKDLNGLIKMAGAFPQHTKALIRTVLEDDDEFKRLITNTNDLIKMANKFPQIAKALINNVLKDPREFKRIVFHPLHLIKMIEIFPHHAQALIKLDTDKILEKCIDKQMKTAGDVVKLLPALDNALVFLCTIIGSEVLCLKLVESVQTTASKDLLNAQAELLKCKLKDMNFKKLAKKFSVIYLNEVIHRDCKVKSKMSTPNNFQGACQLLAKSVNSNTPLYYKKMNRFAIIMELFDYISGRKIVNQLITTLCGVASVTSALIAADKKLFVETSILLAETGRDKGEFNLSVHENSKISETSIVNAFLHSLRHSTNMILGYPGPKTLGIFEPIFGLTRPRIIVNLLEKFLDVMSESSKVNGVNGDEINIVTRALMGGLYSDMHNSPTINDKKIAELSNHIKKRGGIIMLVTEFPGFSLPHDNIGNYGFEPLHYLYVSRISLEKGNFFMGPHIAITFETLGMRRSVQWPKDHFLKSFRGTICFKNDSTYGLTNEIDGTSSDEAFEITACAMQ